MRPFRRLRTTRRHPPSAVAVERFARDVDREVSDLRAGLADDIILALLLLENGDPAEASNVVDVGSARLRRFQDSLEESVAAASVEREAEAVVTRARHAPASGSERRAPLRTFVTATAAAVAIVGALFVVASPPSDAPQMLAGARGEAGAVHSQAADHPVRDVLALRYDRTPATSTAADSALARGEDGVGVLRLFDGPRSSLTRLGERSGGPLAVLLGVERLVVGLIPTESPPSVVEKLERLEGTYGPTTRNATAPVRHEDEPEPESSDGSDQPSTEPSDPPSEAPGGPSEEPDPSETASGDEPDGSDTEEPPPWRPGDATGGTTGDGSSGSSDPSPDADADDGIF